MPLDREQAMERARVVADRYSDEGLSEFQGLNPKQFRCLERLISTELMAVYALAAEENKLPEGAVVYVPTGERKSHFQQCETFMDIDGELRYFNYECHWTWADDNPRPVYRRLTPTTPEPK